MSAIAFGYASCTGLSIMFLDALRSVGVPARLVGTPAWHGTFADGRPGRSNGGGNVTWDHGYIQTYLGPWQLMEVEVKAWSFGRLMRANLNAL